MTDSLTGKRRRRIRRIIDTTGHHFGLGECKPLRGFPEGEALVFESRQHFTRVQIIFPLDPAKEAISPNYHPSRQSPPPCTDPPCREFFVKVSDDGEWWEPGIELELTNPETTPSKPN